MIVFQNFKLQSKQEVLDEYNIPSISYVDLSDISTKLVVSSIKESEQQLTSPKPIYQAHTSTKDIKKGTFLFNGVQRFRVEYVDNVPRLSVLYLKEI